MASGPQKPYPWQAECAEKVKNHNTIIAAPTGKGKTRIAALAIDHFLAQTPDKYVVFTVPTKNLVEQQAKQCEQNCRPQPKVARLCGAKMDSWDGLQWRSCIRKHRLLVGTPEVFRQALESGYLSPAHMSLLIFDECHNATGNSPMARIMRDSIQHAGEQPRILGLTPTHCHGRMKRKRDAEIAKITLEELLLAKIFCPIIPNNSDGPSKQWHTVPYPSEKLEDEFGTVVERCVEMLIRDCDPSGSLQELHKVTARLKHVLGQLGRDAFIYCIKNNIVHHLTYQAAELAQLRDRGAQVRAAQLRRLLPEIRAKLRTCTDTIVNDPELLKVPKSSQKAGALCKLIEGPEAGQKGVVFVTQIMMTCPLANLIQQHVAGVQAEGMYGAMAESDRDAAIRRFRQGQTQVLVSTDMLLEGFDVPDCAWVARFNEFHTTKSHTQGSGRARLEKANIYYFENDPEDEQDRARLMESVARDEELHATEEYIQELADQRVRRTADSRGVHPFEEPNCQPIHFFNGLDIVYMWCQQVLGQAMNSEDIVKYASSEEGRGIREVKFPSTDGWKTVTIEEIDKHWGLVRVEDAVEPSRCRNLSRDDKERRRALFVAALRLRQLHYVDGNNEPNAQPLLHAKRAHVSAKRLERFRIRNTFARAAPEVKSGNYIEALHTLVQQRWCGAGSGKTQDMLKYTSSADKGGGWVTSLQVVPVDENFLGDPQPTKRAAEQSAAKKAYNTVVVH